ncbi:twin-arginine translocase TatA/TatE family subunit [Cellvibrio japonicus]|nr:twin-arginine translocase TatA/TatE family subunit [Cellvibrio japonicus]QEI11399.1 twin-arginine translocase TatA/TatE family subunit [Cellvibrio japonicus]QEI14973.1 twin-arginine translocase TatA/TatE family subunit [Cellvibrio japonicus]QEI18553.1 twin-arginine translocase TatA/TatE family subunit [Cellvibrio japonicus]
MGISGISIWQLLIVLAIVVMLFGTKRLRTLGSDLGSMIKGFKSSMNNGEEGDKNKEEPTKPQSVEDKSAGVNSATVHEKSDQKH